MNCKVIDLPRSVASPEASPASRRLGRLMPVGRAVLEFARPLLDRVAARLGYRRDHEVGLDQWVALTTQWMAPRPTEDAGREPACVIDFERARAARAQRRS